MTARLGRTTACYGRRARTSLSRVWILRSGRYSSMRAARCWCWPAPAPARRRPWSRRRSPGCGRASPVEHILMLTFSRRAAAELRERVTGRLDRTVREPIARTLHSYAFGVLRMAAFANRQPDTRLLAAAEQDVVVRDLLAMRLRHRMARRAAPGAADPTASRPSCATC